MGLIPRMKLMELTELMSGELTECGADVTLQMCEATEMLGLRTFIAGPSGLTLQCGYELSSSKLCHCLPSMAIKAGEYPKVMTTCPPVHGVQHRSEKSRKNRASGRCKKPERKQERSQRDRGRGGHRDRAM